MPLLRMEHAQFAVLLLSLPVQYLIVEYMGSTESSRSFAIAKLMNEISSFSLSDTITRWFTNLFKYSRRYPYFYPYSEQNEDETIPGESPAFEVLEYRSDKGYFSKSATVRQKRPPELKFRVGQVIWDKRWGYRGVIIGWDRTAKAPEPWLNLMHDDPNWRWQPNYLILADSKDIIPPQTIYAPQDNIELIHRTQVNHPDLDEYFHNFDGNQYLPRPWLRGLYPKD